MFLEHIRQSQAIPELHKEMTEDLVRVVKGWGSLEERLALLMETITDSKGPASSSSVPELH